MRSLFALCGVALLGACAVRPAPVAVTPALPPPPVAARVDPYCAEERQEARVADRIADRERREARAYGGRRQAYEAELARAEANRQRNQAARAC